MSNTDHLAKAKDYIAIAESDDSKAEAYRKAAREIKAERQNGTPWSRINGYLGRNERYAQNLVKGIEGGLINPFGGPRQDIAQSKSRAKKALRDPELRRQVIESLSPEERTEVWRSLAGTTVPEDHPEVWQEPGRDGAKEAVDASLGVQVARMLTQVSRVEVLLGEGKGFDNLNAKATERMLSDLDHAESVIGRLRDAAGTHGRVRVVA